jgi:hypothetical protein
MQCFAGTIRGIDPAALLALFIIKYKGVVTADT